MTLLKLFVREYIDKFLHRITKEIEAYMRGDRSNPPDIEAMKHEISLNFLNKLLLQYSVDDLQARFSLVKKMSRELVKALTSMRFRIVLIDAMQKTTSVLGVSQGILRTVFEVGMSWDYVLDLPTIPASSIKGAVRSVIENLVSSGSKCRECLEYVEVLFGKGGHDGWAGLLMFFDTYPIDIKNSWNRLIEPDIVSPHYMHGTEVKRFERLVEPVPVPHVSIAPGVVFRFIVAAEPGEEVEEALKGLMECFGRNYAGLGPAIASLLLTAFHYGIGARTSRGYGKFEIVKMDVVVNGNKFSTPILFEPSMKRRGRTSRKGGRK